LDVFQLLLQLSDTMLELNTQLNNNSSSSTTAVLSSNGCGLPNSPSSSSVATNASNNLLQFTNNILANTNFLNLNSTNYLFNSSQNLLLEEPELETCAEANDTITTTITQKQEENGLSTNSEKVCRSATMSSGEETSTVEESDSLDAAIVAVNAVTNLNKRFINKNQKLLQKSTTGTNQSVSENSSSRVLTSNSNNQNATKSSGSSSSSLSNKPNFIENFLQKTIYSNSNQTTNKCPSASPSSQVPNGSQLGSGSGSSASSRANSFNSIANIINSLNNRSIASSSIGAQINNQLPSPTSSSSSLSSATTLSTSTTATSTQSKPSNNVQVNNNPSYRLSFLKKQFSQTNQNKQQMNNYNQSNGSSYDQDHYANMNPDGSSSVDSCSLSLTSSSSSTRPFGENNETQKQQQQHQQHHHLFNYNGAKLIENLYDKTSVTQFVDSLLNSNYAAASNMGTLAFSPTHNSTGGIDKSTSDFYSLSTKTSAMNGLEVSGSTADYQSSTNYANENLYQSIDDDLNYACSSLSSSSVAAAVVAAAAAAAAASAAVTSTNNSNIKPAVDNSNSSSSSTSQCSKNGSLNPKPSFLLKATQPPQQRISTTTPITNQILARQQQIISAATNANGGSLHVNTPLKTTIDSSNSSTSSSGCGGSSSIVDLSSLPLSSSSSSSSTNIVADTELSANSNLNQHNGASSNRHSLSIKSSDFRAGNEASQLQQTPSTPAHNLHSDAASSSSNQRHASSSNLVNEQHQHAVEQLTVTLSEIASGSNNNHHQAASLRLPPRSGAVSPNECGSVAGLAANYYSNASRSNSISYKYPPVHSALTSPTHNNHHYQPPSTGSNSSNTTTYASTSIAHRKPSFKFESNILNRVQNMNMSKIKCFNNNNNNANTNSNNSSNCNSNSNLANGASLSQQNAKNYHLKEEANVHNVSKSSSSSSIQRSNNMDYDEDSTSNDRSMFASHNSGESEYYSNGGSTGGDYQHYYNQQAAQHIFQPHLNYQQPNYMCSSEASSLHHELANSNKQIKRQQSLMNGKTSAHMPTTPAIINGYYNGKSIQPHAHCPSNLPAAAYNGPNANVFIKSNHQISLDSGIYLPSEIDDNANANMHLNHMR
jgi:trimeric autotransporter adhesin